MFASFFVGQNKGTLMRCTYMLRILFCKFTNTIYSILPVTPQAGTPYYTAPEMIVRDPYSYPADCWSFGVIMHQLLALERPFEGSSTAELVKSILSGEIPPLPAHYSDDIK